MFERALHSAGWSSLVARRAHNPKVVGSNPAPATKNTIRPAKTGRIFSFQGGSQPPKPQSGGIGMLRCSTWRCSTAHPHLATPVPILLPPVGWEGRAASQPPPSCWRSRLPPQAPMRRACCPWAGSRSRTLNLPQIG